jgi:BolA protein
LDHKLPELSSRLARLERIFRTNLTLVYFEIENESAKHSGHYSGDGETHWRVLLVARDFQGLSRVQRHQRVNELVKLEFELGLHALALKLLDAEEWERIKITHFDAPS